MVQFCIISKKNRINIKISDINPDYRQGFVIYCAQVYPDVFPRKHIAGNGIRNNLN